MDPALAQTIRRWVMTGSVAAVTATGAWYGAGLKAKQEFKQERQARLEASPAEKIQQLETYRAQLLQKKNALDKKLSELEARNRAKAGVAEEETKGRKGGAR